MAVRIGINGGGRIGRLVARMAMLERRAEVVAVNNHADARTLAHLLMYDSVHGRYPGEIRHAGDTLLVDNSEIPVLRAEDPADLPWEMLGVDIAVEATGCFVDEKSACKHLQAGARRVLVTAPVKGKAKTVVMGVNEHTLRREDRIVSSSSCTTNCLAPMAKVLHDAFGIEKGMMTTVHAYTRDQNLLDGSHRDLRRARAAGFSIVPTTTGAASSIGQVIPELQGRLDGMAVRVPVPDGSYADLVALLRMPVSAELVNAAFQEAAEGTMKGIVEYTEVPLVSADIVGNPHSCVLDAASTLVVGDNLVKVCGWYDNEWGYARRCLELVEKMAEMQGQEPVHTAGVVSARSNGRARRLEYQHR
jgi:glyceraldehyde 3-phosphate dehydrogenase